MTRKNPGLKVGAAEVDFTPAPGLQLVGQMHVRRGAYVRDPLMANAVAFRQGRTAVVLVSVDICIMDDAFVRRVQKTFERRTGCAGGRLLLHATHCHVAPGVFRLLNDEPDPAFVARLEDAIITAAGRALEGAAAADVFSGAGIMERLGWNRRAMYADGSSRMYGNSDQPGFIGMEGPRDPTLNVLVARDASGAVRAVLVNFATHPNCVESESFYSADLAGEVRRQLKALLGPDVVVAYLTGAGANTAPSILDPHDPQQLWRGESGLRRSGLYLAGEAAKAIAVAVHPMQAPTLAVAETVERIPLRHWPKPEEPNFPEPLRKGGTWPDATEYYERARRQWKRRLTTLSPWSVRLHAIRIGDTAICTNPAELFVEFGLAMRAASPARVTFVTELTDGYCGYVPTPLAFSRGGYETWPAPSSQLAPQAGLQIVRATGSLLQNLFAK